MTMLKELPSGLRIDDLKESSFNVHINHKLVFSILFHNYLGDYQLRKKIKLI
jgi:hypothetical protein